MKHHAASVRAISRLANGRPLVRIACPQAAIPGPGQPVLAHKPGVESFQRLTLFPRQILEDGFRCPLPEQEGWQPGDQLDLLGPIGGGFSPPANTSRWLLLSQAAHFSPLLPLLGLADESGASIVVVGPEHPAQLPESVEVLPEAEPAIEWADFVAVSLPMAGLSHIKGSLGRYRDLPLPCPAQVLLHDPIPCGFGACLCCGLSDNSGLVLRCQQGPVFEWNKLNV